MKLTERFKRWRAERGYGVHSPLAFRIVKHVVRPDRNVAYYGEPLLEFREKEASDRKMLRRAKMILRFAAELQPAYVWASPGIPEIYLEAIKLAGCAVRIYDGGIFPDEIGKADMIVIDAAAADAIGKKRKKNKDTKSLKEILKGLKSLREGVSLIGFDLEQGMIKGLTSKINGGVTIEGVSSLMAVSASSSALHSYSILPF